MFVYIVRRSRARTAANLRRSSTGSWSSSCARPTAVPTDTPQATWAFRIHNWKKSPASSSGKDKSPAAAQAEKGASAGQGTLTGGQRTEDAAIDGASPAQNARETV